MARSLAPERLPVDVVAELDEEDRLVYKRLLIADEAEALHRFHVYVAAHQKRDHRPNADRKSIVKTQELAPRRHVPRSLSRMQSLALRRSCVTRPSTYVRL